MKEILAYSNSARPSKAEVGQLFINVRTGETFIFKEDKWHPIEPVVPTPEKTPSAPEKELPVEEIVEEKIEESAPVEEKVEESPKPKKAPARKKSTKKEASK